MKKFVLKQASLAADPERPYLKGFSGPDRACLPRFGGVQREALTFSDRAAAISCIDLQIHPQLAFDLVIEEIDDEDRCKHCAHMRKTHVSNPDGVKSTDPLTYGARLHCMPEYIQRGGSCGCPGFEPGFEENSSDGDEEAAEPPQCDAIVNVYDTTLNLSPRVATFKTRQCFHRAKKQLGDKRFCAVHTRMATEGLIDASGAVADPRDRRAMKDNPSLRFSDFKGVEPTDLEQAS